jgi:hypothetical protein
MNNILLNANNTGHKMIKPFVTWPCLNTTVRHFYVNQNIQIMTNEHFTATANNLNPCHHGSQGAVILLSPGPGKNYNDLKMK